MRFVHFLCILLIAVLISCTGKRKVAEHPALMPLYKPGTTFLHPDYLIFHQDETQSQLLIRINQEELLFNQANAENALEAQVKIQYKLIDITTDPNNKVIADSATLVTKVNKETAKLATLITALFKASYGKIYSLNIVITDILRNVSQQNMLFVNKLNRFTGQNYKVVSRRNESPIFRNYLLPEEVVRIITNQPDVKKYYIKYKKDNTPLPPPPFSVQTEQKFIFKADSMWTLPYTQQRSFAFQYTGLYLIQTDTSQIEGLLISNPGKSFPKVTEASMMIPPLEYLTTTEEFSNLLKSQSPKSDLDNFWIKATGNTENARELIRIFYNRMLYTNLFFTSYKEGWKTDRGMIYLIFGPPSLVSKNNKGETWEYYVKQDASNVSFTFTKVSSPYSENHYLMERNDSYTRFWRSAVDSWRKGKVFSLEE